MFAPKERLAHSLCSASIIARALWGGIYRPSYRGFRRKACTACGSKRPLYSSSDCCMSMKLYGPPSRVFRPNIYHTYHNWYMTCLRVCTAKKKWSRVCSSSPPLDEYQYTWIWPRLSSITPTRNCDATALDLKSVTNPTPVWHQQTAERTDILRTQRQHSKQGGMARSFFLFRIMQGTFSNLYTYLCTTG